MSLSLLLFLLQLLLLLLLQDILASWSTPFKERYGSQQGAHYFELSFVESAVSILLLCNLRPAHLHEDCIVMLHVTCRALGAGRSPIVSCCACCAGVICYRQQ